MSLTYTFIRMLYSTYNLRKFLFIEKSKQEKFIGHWALDTKK